MLEDIVSIPRSHIMDATAFVPAAHRPAFLATLLVGSSGYAAAVGAPPESGDEDEDGPSSVILSAQQARKLKDKLDPATWDVIRTAVTNMSEDAGAVIGTVDWSKVKELTGVKSWTIFAKGRLSGLTRALRNIDGVPKDAILIWEGEGWVEDGHGDYSAGTLGIDGPVVHVLRSVMGITAA